MGKLTLTYDRYKGVTSKRCKFVTSLNDVERNDLGKSFIRSGNGISLLPTKFLDIFSSQKSRVGSNCGRYASIP